MAKGPGESPRGSSFLIALGVSFHRCESVEGTTPRQTELTPLRPDSSPAVPVV
jgi:hypothetical protein